MFRIMLLLCYSLIDTNTIPFYFSLSQIGRAESHTQRFGLTVSFRRFSSSFYESYPMGGASTSTSLMPQLVQAVIPPQHVVICCFYTNKQNHFKMILWNGKIFTSSKRNDIHHSTLNYNR